MVSLELGFKSLKQREGIGRTPGESGQDPVMVQAADLAGGRLDHDVSEGDLTISAQGDTVAPAHREDRGAVKNARVQISRRRVFGAVRAAAGLQATGWRLAARVVGEYQWPRRFLRTNRIRPIRSE